MKKIFLIFLAVCLVFGTVFAGCKGGQTEIIEEETPVYTEYDFINNGTSEYKIVKPAESSTFESFAAQEMQYFLKEATGCDIEIIDDSGLSYSENSKYIAIGNTSLFTGRGISVSDCNYSGYVIKTVGRSVFINGSSGNGILQGVYGFLRKFFNYEYYAQDEFKIDKVNSMNLPDVNLLHNPAVPIGQVAYLSQESNIQYTRRTGLLSKYDIWMMAGNSSEGWTHTTLEWVNPSAKDPNDPENRTYRESHPEWFNNGELCFTRDNGDDNDEMFQLILNQMIEHIRTGGDKVFLSLTQQDTESWCGCGKCKAEHDKYNSNLAVMIKYANRIIRKIDEWKAKNNVTKDVKLAIFAYQKTMDPPVVRGENGEWAPVAPEVVCEDNIMIQYCPLRMSMVYDMQSPANANFAEQIQQLHVLCKHIGVWWYSTYYHTLLLPLNDFECFQSTLKFLVDNDVLWLFREAQATNGSCSFEQLRIFITYKMYDDPDADLEALISDFFDNYFKDASVPMKNFFDGWRLLSTFNRDVLEMSGDVGSENVRSLYFPYGTLQSWEKSIEEAYAAIEKYKTTDPELYSKLEQRICREAISVRYLMMTIYPSYYSDKDLLNERKLFKYDCTRLGITQYGGGYLSDLYSEWGV